MTDPGVFPGTRKFDSRRISLLNEISEGIRSAMNRTLLSNDIHVATLQMVSMEQRSMFMIRLCSDHAAYEAVPKKRIRFDLAALKEAIERGAEWTAIVHTPQFLVMKRDDAVEVTVVDDGRMIIRNVADERSAEEIAEGIAPASTRTK